MKLRNAYLQVNENIFHVLSFKHFAFIFLEYITITFSRLKYIFQEI